MDEPVKLLPPSCSGRWKAELREIGQLAGPIAISNFFGVFMQLTDLAFIGHLGADSLAAAALGNTLFNLLYYCIVGAATVIDTYASQAFGSRNKWLVGMYTIRGTLLMTGLAIIGTILLACAPQVFAVVMPGSKSGPDAGRFAQLLAPSILPWVLYLCNQKFLIAQGIVWPCVLVSLLAAVVNIGLNAWLVGALGFVGSPLSTTSARCLQLILLFGYTCIFKPHRLNQTWRTPTLKQVFSHLSVFRAMAVLAAGGLVMTAAEAWAFDMTVIFAGFLHSAVALDAHTVLLNLCGLAFASLAFSVSVGGSVRVGTLLGKGKPQDARTAAAVCIVTGATTMSFMAVLFIFGGELMARIFTRDEAVLREVGKITWAAGVFQIQDGIQACAAGVLRGMGKQVQVAIVNAVCFWLIGTPFGLIMTFAPGHLGVLGLWLGLLLALTCMNVVYAWVLWRADWEAAAAVAQARGSAGEDMLLASDEEDEGGVQGGCSAEAPLLSKIDSLNMPT